MRYKRIGTVLYSFIACLVITFLTCLNLYSACPVPAVNGIQPFPSEMVTIFNKASNNELGASAPVYPTIWKGLPPNSTRVVPYVPAILLKAVGWTESEGWKQFSANYGQTGPTLIGYTTGCGYGIMQITSGMNGSDPSFNPNRVASEYIYNIGTGAKFLIDKWNGIIPAVGENDPKIIEEWYFAVWTYNSGVSFSNNPNNPKYNQNRPPFISRALSGDAYPYQEKVWGYVANSPGTQFWDSVSLTLPDRSLIGNWPNTALSWIPCPLPYHKEGDSQPPTPSITGITPSQPIVSSTRQWVNINGTNFVSSSQATLVCNGDGIVWTIPPERTSFVSTNRIDVYVGLYATGTWTAQITNPGNVKSNIFTFNVNETTFPAQPPVAEASISITPNGPYYGYQTPISVIKGQNVSLYFFADEDINGDSLASYDPDGWTNPENGVSSGGKAEWNTDINQGTPTFESTIANPSSPAACNIGPFTYVFNDAPGIYEYQILRITDKKGLQSNVSKIRIQVTAPPIIALNLQTGWNMVSCPGDPVTNNWSTLLAGKNVAQYAFTYNSPAKGFDVANTLEFNKGYLIYAYQNSIQITVQYQPRSIFSCQLSKGWNMIGSVSGNLPVSSITKNPTDTMLYFYRMIPPSSFDVTNNIITGEGYLVYADKACNITVSYSSPSPSLISITQSKLTSSVWESTLKVVTKSMYRELVFGMHLLASNGFDIPMDVPIPPLPSEIGDIIKAGWLVEDKDVSMLSHSFVKDGQHASWELSVELPESGELQWSDLPKSYRYLLLYEGQMVRMDQLRSILLPAGKHNITLVVDATGSLPSKTQLMANYPNPFNPETWIPYELSKDAQVEIRVYSSAGQLVRRLDLGYKQAGNYTKRTEAAYWDGKNEAGDKVSSGVYFYTLQTKEFSQTRKLVIIR